MMADVNSRTLVIAVVTYLRNAELIRCLDSLNSIQSPPALSTQVLVIDNSPGQNALPAVSSHPVQATYIHEPSPGIVAARNRALDYVEDHGIDLVAFVDDDETVRSDWLGALVAAVDAHHAEAATGPLEPVFTGGDMRVIDAGYFSTPGREVPDGQSVPVAATNNVLITRKSFCAPNRLRFDDSYASSGGEDTHFFRTLHQRGGDIRWAADALVFDHVPASRVTFAWARRRAMRCGAVDARVAMDVDGAPRIETVLAGAARVAVGLSKVLLRSLTLRRLRASDTRTLLRGIGWLRGSFGLGFVAYRGPGT